MGEGRGGGECGSIWPETALGEEAVIPGDGAGVGGFDMVEAGQGDDQQRRRLPDRAAHMKTSGRGRSSPAPHPHDGVKLGTDLRGRNKTVLVIAQRFRRRGRTVVGH